MIIFLENFGRHSRKFRFCNFRKILKKKSVIKSSIAHIINFKKIWNKQISENYFYIFRKILENNEKHRVNPEKNRNFLPNLILEKF